MTGLRAVRRRWHRVRPWIARVLLWLDWADWKTWVWYGLLGIERLANAWLVAAKRRGFDPADLQMVRGGRFKVVPRKGKDRWPQSTGRTSAGLTR